MKSSALALLLATSAAAAAAYLQWRRRQRSRHLRHRTGILIPNDDPDPSGLATNELSKDTTGCIGRIVWPASEILCDFLMACDSKWLQSLESVIELGSGVGVPGMLAARLGIRSVCLTDYHPLVLAALRETIVANGLSHACTVMELNWSDDGNGEEPEAWPSLAIGADLTWTTKGALDLARAVHRVLGWRAGGDGVFVYAHIERLALSFAPDRTIRRDEVDTALRALCNELTGGGSGGGQVACRELYRGSAEGDDDTVILQAFGSVAAIDLLLRGSKALAALTPNALPPPVPVPVAPLPPPLPPPAFLGEARLASVGSAQMDIAALDGASEPPAPTVVTVAGTAAALHPFRTCGFHDGSAVLALRAEVVTLDAARSQLAPIASMAIACYAHEWLASDESERRSTLRRRQLQLRIIGDFWLRRQPQPRSPETMRIASVLLGEHLGDQGRLRAFLASYLEARGLPADAAPRCLPQHRAMFAEYFSAFPEQIGNDPAFDRCVRVVVDGQLCKHQGVAVAQEDDESAVVGHVLMGHCYREDGVAMMQGILACPFYSQHVRTVREAVPRDPLLGIADSLLLHLWKLWHEPEPPFALLRVHPFAGTAHWRERVVRMPFARDWQGRAFM